jgi:hypothetical protein
MTKKTNLLFLLFSCMLGSVYGQTLVANFDAISPTVTTKFGATFSVVSSPNPTGNTTNCGKIGRTSTNWYELITFPITSYMVPANTTKYLHILVNFPAQPDVIVRLDGSATDNDGTVNLRPLNNYTNFNQWQDLVVQIDGGLAGVTVNYIVFMADAGFNNVPAGRILNNSNSFGYIDELTFTDSSSPTLGNSKYEFDNSIAIYPNSTNALFKIETSFDITNVSLYNILGKEIIKNIPKINKNEYDISNVSSGLYIVKMIDDKGALATRKLIKK